MKCFVMTGVGLAISARLVAAQPAGAQAEILFREGKDLLAKGRTAEACAAFDASQKLDPTPSTMLNQANCREKNDQLASAWGLFLVTERDTRTSTDEAIKHLHKTAVDHAAKLEARLSTLTIRVPEDAKVGGLEIVRDKEAVDPALWNKALPVDGGTYQIIAHAPGNAEWTTTISVANERDAKTIEIPTLKAAELHQGTAGVPAIPQVRATTAESVSPEPPPKESPADPHRTNYMPFYVGGAAMVTLGVGLVLELVAESTDNRAKTDLDAATQLSKWHTANNERYAAEAFGVAGLATAGVAVWLYLREGREHRMVVPTVAADRVGIQLVGGF